MSIKICKIIKMFKIKLLQFTEITYVVLLCNNRMIM